MHKLKGSLCVALMLGSIVLARALEPNDPDLVGLWLFDDGSGDVATDSSGNGNDATLNGDFEWIDGAFGGGILSKGGGSIDVPTSDSINSISEALTVAGWFRVDADSDTGVRRQNAFLLEDQSASEPVPNGWSFRIWTTDGLSPGIYGTTEVPQGEWHHIAGVWDGTQMRLYIDGVEEAELRTDANAQTDGVWGGTIGQPGDILQLKYGSETFIGGMDEIVIFSRALSADEIEALTLGWEKALPVQPRGKLATAWGSLKVR